MVDGPAKDLTALRLVLAFSLVSTALHYAHNTFAVDEYPPVSGVSRLAAQIVVATAWFVLTAAGIAGYLAYVRGRHWAARAWLLVYSLSGLVTLGHFLVGPLDIPPFWYATVFTDAAAALALWVFVVWSAVRDRQAVIPE